MRNEIGAFILRITLGVLFFVHGFVKFQGGMENTEGWFTSIGLPGFMAYVVASIELVGGFALILGFATRIVSALIGFIMIGAIVKVKLSAGFVGGYEFDLALLAMAGYLTINGNKFLAIDSVIFKNDNTISRSA